MNGYIAFYNSKQIEIKASDLYDAKCQAVKEMKVPKSKAHMVSVVLAELEGEQVVHAPSF